jgi:hypothetical protein
MEIVNGKIKEIRDYHQAVEAKGTPQPGDPTTS